ncbi:Bifunctional bis(5'-adenosyl)-triphosphatase/adenylylsulfatase FHIT [Sesamum angolense]|uniref:Bifunctional bis(5'-adenosyl)-triphosphatase/adenylylsulfatase FHIT n=1 Tax=Sesamum angolense TaxID=2727404 RepID=A0AAE1XBF1_9LAMI|nr:Bifunctional bis(5'-adenosyl)-triphosphatase/adenylylsulfatase FHIT [Sesamum angolense]
MPRWSLRVIPFGPYKIGAKEVFYSTQLSYAFVNLRPVVPGIDLSRVVDYLLLYCSEVISFPLFIFEQHIVIDCKLLDITWIDSDLWLTAQKIGHQLESYHNASSLTFTIQDGPKAGQTVPHVHIHILPRKSGDFENNDEIYEAEKELKQKLDLDKERRTEAWRRWLKRRPNTGSFSRR